MGLLEMNPMQEKALRVLEFIKIRDQMASFALTKPGSDACRALLPYDNLQEASYAQEETQEAHMILTFRGEHPLREFKDVRPWVNLAIKGSTLSPVLCLTLLTF